MRYQSFYPFSQSQIPNTPQQQAPPAASGFLSGLFGSKNASPPPAPVSNQFRGNPQQMPFGFRNTGMPQVPNQFPETPSTMPLEQENTGAPKPNRMDHYLQTADRFLSTAEQITPMVQRVSPMFQNIPALWKIYKGFKSMPNATAFNDVASTAAAAATTSAAVPSGTAIPSVSGKSIPRIFQPPL